MMEGRRGELKNGKRGKVNIGGRDNSTCSTGDEGVGKAGILIGFLWQSLINMKQQITSRKSPLMHGGSEARTDPGKRNLGHQCKESCPRVSRPKETEQQVWGAGPVSWFIIPTYYQDRNRFFNEQIVTTTKRYGGRIYP